MLNKKHRCTLKLGSDSMLPKSKTFWGKIWRNFRKLGQLSMHHPDMLYYFRSYSTVVAERQRLLLEEGGRVIHPLSVLSIIWDSFMVLVNIMHMTVSPFRLFYDLGPIRNLYLQNRDKQLLTLHLFCLADVIIKFNTGYVTKKYSTITVDRRSVACHYMKRWFIFDLISCTPLAFLLLHQNIESPRLLLIAHMMPLVRLARICTVSANMKTFIQLFSGSYLVQGIARLPVVLILSAHWCACLMYLPPVVIYYWTEEMPLHYNYYLHKDGGVHGGNLMYHSVWIRYTKAIVIVVSGFFGTGFSMFHSNLPDELLIHSFIIVYATVFMVFTLVFLIKTYLTIFDSTTRYNSLMNQVEEYMKYRQFPPSLKKRVESFYKYRYQRHYFKEEANLNCLSEELRDEISLHTSRSLIHKVKLFENVPASTVGTVLGCLHPEVYLANDLVVAAGDIGECMYFIATGTVAVYSLKGVEVCHLEDGAHFGEVALLMKDSKRVATVVAVEITQLYRLDAFYFKRYILTHPMLYERIQALASRRMHETVLVDDAFRQERHMSTTSAVQE